MKKVRFEAVQMTGKVQDSYCYRDLGAVDDVFLAIRAVYKIIREPYDEEHVRKQLKKFHLTYTGTEQHFGQCLGLISPKDKNIAEVYTLHKDTGCSLTNLFIRGHEEGHAACILGLKPQLEYLIGEPISKKFRGIPLQDLKEEDGLYAMKIRGIIPFNPIE